jgi:hypothetical protein
MKAHNFLNVFNISKALHLLENNLDYAAMSDDLVMVVAHDNTVWVCREDGSSCALDNLKLVQRIV